MYEESKIESTANGVSLPLVSVVVLTFNSDATVLETLDSLLRQDYPMLELIVADDGSKDNTIATVKDWITRNGKSFQRAVLLGDGKNHGICRNVHGGYAEAQGDWIKPIAGDDFLFPGAIARYVEFVRKNDCSVVSAAVVPFVDSASIDLFNCKVIPASKDVEIISAGAEQLCAALYMRNLIPAPGIFLKRADYTQVGGVDLRFFHLDDWPLWLNLLRNKRKFAYLPTPSVAYRISETTVSASKSATDISKEFLTDHITMYYEYQRENLGILQKWDRMLEIFRFKLARGMLRPYPKIYKITGFLRLASPAYIALKLGISKNSREKLDSGFVKK